MITLDSESLTDRQFALVCDCRQYPGVVTGPRLKTARSLERKLWGTVETGGSGEVIFRLNQDGCNALEWVHDLEDD